MEALITVFQPGRVVLFESHPVQVAADALVLVDRAVDAVAAHEFTPALQEAAQTGHAVLGSDPVSVQIFAS